MPALLPKKDVNACDDCGTELVIRKDDRKKPIMERQKIYADQTEPIIDFYRNETDTEVIDFEPKKGRRDFPQVKLLLGSHLIAPTIDGEKLD